MNLQTIERETGSSPRASIIVLHGLGADGHDFVPLAGELDLAAAGPVRFVFPHAPTRPVTINGGMVMRAWYDILGLDFTRRGEDEPGLRASQREIEALIEHETSRGVPASRIVLAGFSQGCAMALLTGLRHAEQLAGIVGLSGYLPLAVQTASERHAANAHTPVFLAHGRLDPVVPFAAGLATRQALQLLGHPVEWHEYAMPHAVCAQEIADLNAWLLKVLA
ncbi:MAG: dienelactone hydrolase family protein [Pseudomonadota bacterium]